MDNTDYRMVKLTDGTTIMGSITLLIKISYESQTH